MDEAELGRERKVQRVDGVAAVGLEETRDAEEQQQGGLEGQGRADHPPNPVPASGGPAARASFQAGASTRLPFASPTPSLAEKEPRLVHESYNKSRGIECDPGALKCRKRRLKLNFVRC